MASRLASQYITYNIEQSKEFDNYMKKLLAYQKIMYNFSLF